jgi:hypothetical protein
MTDAQGKYRIPSIVRKWPDDKAVNVQLVVTKEGFAGRDTESFRFEPVDDTPQAAATVRLALGNSVKGTVVDPAGCPVQGAWVRPGRSYADRIQWTATDEKGQFTVRDLPEGIVTIAFNYGKLWATGRYAASRNPETVTIQLRLSDATRPQGEER